MANKAISELPQALNVNNQDLFVLEQSGITKKLTAETFITEQGIIDALAEALDGHGGISSVTLSSVSGRIRTYLITFTDETSTTFQVLDGTSIDRITKTSTAGLTDTYTVFMSDGTTTFFTVTNGADGTVSEAMLNDALKDKAPAITETTESGAIANFTDGADDLVMHHVVAEINPVQSGSGDPSPSNIRPISGWTGCTVYHSEADTSNPETISISWQSEAGTVYGGTIDVATGLLTVTHRILDLGTKTYTKGNRNTDNTGYIFYFRDATNIAFSGDAVCSALKTVTNIPNWEALPVNSCNAAKGSYMVFCADYADAASFKTAMNGVQLVYTMATSQTYQLSGQQLKTLLGTNNVWADTGNVSVTYPADTKMFIEKLTMPTEDDMVANQAISSGTFFMVGNTLYKATAAIANGATITPGTNATKLSLADALNLLNT